MARYAWEGHIARSLAAHSQCQALCITHSTITSTTLICKGQQGEVAPLDCQPTAGPCHRRFQWKGGGPAVCCCWTSHHSKHETRPVGQAVKDGLGPSRRRVGHPWPQESSDCSMSVRTWQHPALSGPVCSRPHTSLSAAMACKAYQQQQACTSSTTCP